jgi:FlaA1/EpsC-like NDP-sugar epimerase
MRAAWLGNVLGSQGSVVPIFLQQISEGGPVSATHQVVNRYFLSLSDAVELALLTTSLDWKEGIFIPNPGVPVQILDPAKRFVGEAGFEPVIEIPIVMTGLRLGDKMTEDFVSDLELVDSADDARLRLITTPQLSPEGFDSSIAALKESVARRHLAEILKQLCWLVPEYRPSDNDS